MLTPDHLRPYQQRAVEFMIQEPDRLLLLDMGLGKTIITLTAMVAVGGRTLVVAPKRVCESVWLQEAADWSHTQGLTFSVCVGPVARREHALHELADVVLVNYENLEWLCQSKWVRDFDTVVFDEISMMKNTSAGRFKKWRRVRGKFKRHWGLTGTPVPNKLLDLFGIVGALDGGATFGKAITPFKEQWFRAVDYERHVWVPRAGTEAHMTSAMAPLCYRLSSEQHVDLPPVVMTDVMVTLPPDVRTTYDTLERDFFAEWDGRETLAANEAVLLGKLQQLAQGQIYDDDGVGVTPVHEEKLGALLDLIEQAQGQPMLVGYTFKHDRDAILARVPGARALDDAADVEAWNRGEVPVMVLHPKSGGHGLNLQHGGARLVLYGMNWSLELYQQLIARLARPGQSSDHVFVWRIVAAGTVDEAILFRVEGEKAGRQSRVLEGIRRYRLVG